MLPKRRVEEGQRENYEQKRLGNTNGLNAIRWRPPHVVTLDHRASAVYEHTISELLYTIGQTLVEVSTRKEATW